MNRWILAVDYRVSGLRVYLFYSYDAAVSCFENNADPENKDVILSIALFYVDVFGVPELIREVTWR